MQLLITRRVNHALLAEPAVSMALRKTQSFPVSIIAPELHRSVDLQQEWGRLMASEARIPQAGIAALGAGTAYASGSTGADDLGPGVQLNELNATPDAQVNIADRMSTVSPISVYSAVSIQSVQSVQSIQSVDSPNSPKSVKSPKSINSPNSPQSPKSVDSPKSPKSPKSPDSPKSPKSPKSVDSPNSPDSPDSPPSADSVD